MATLLDSANRANETPLNNGGTWKGPVFNGDKQVALISERFANSENAWSNSYWATKFAANQVVRITVAAIVGSRTFELTARIQNPGLSTLNCYYLGITTAGAWELGSVKAGVEATIGTGTKTIAVGDKLWLEPNGTTIKAIHETSAGVKTTVIEKTNSTVSGEGFIGCAANGTGVAWDDFYGGAIEEGGETFTEAVGGTIVITGSVSEALEAAEASEGIVSVTGSAGEADEALESASGAITPEGEALHSLEALEALNGPLLPSGEVIEGMEGAEVAEGSLNRSGSASEILEFLEVASGLVTVVGSIADAVEYVEGIEGAIEVTGSSFALAEFIAAQNGNEPLIGISTEEFTTEEEGEAERLTYLLTPLGPDHRVIEEPDEDELSLFSRLLNLFRRTS